MVDLDHLLFHAFFPPAPEFQCLRYSQFWTSDRDVFWGFRVCRRLGGFRAGWWGSQPMVGELHQKIREDNIRVGGSFR